MADHPRGEVTLLGRPMRYACDVFGPEEPVTEANSGGVFFETEHCRACTLLLGVLAANGGGDLLVGSIVDLECRTATDAYEDRRHRHGLPPVPLLR